MLPPPSLPSDAVVSPLIIAIIWPPALPFRSLMPPLILLSPTLLSPRSRFPPLPRLAHARPSPALPCPAIHGEALITNATPKLQVVGRSQLMPRHSPRDLYHRETRSLCFETPETSLDGNFDRLIAATNPEAWIQTQRSLIQHALRYNRCLKQIRTRIRKHRRETKGSDPFLNNVQEEAQADTWFMPARP